MNNFTFTRVSSKKNTDNDYLRGLGNLTKQKAWLVCCGVRALGIVVKGSDDNGQKSHVTMMTTMTMMTKDMRVLSPCKRPACQAVCTEGGPQ